MKEITPRDWADWPTRDQLVGLSRKADGLFHYAATALQWIEAQIDKENESCLPWVFDKLTQMGGLDQLEGLYKLILTSFEDSDPPAQHALRVRRGERLCGFQHVIGTILVLHKPLTIRQIIALLADIQKNKFDVKHFLQQFRSVLIPGMTASFEEATPQMHKSFRDYMMNAAPPEFRILAGEAHFVTARSCLEVIVRAGSRQSNIVWEYSGQHWHRHLRRAVEEGATCDDERMWNLCGRMVEKAVVDVWAENLMDVFVNVAAAGWGLLKRDTDKHSMKIRMKIISSILTKAKSDLFLSSVVIQIVRPSVPFITINFFCLKPYQSIWVHGLLQTWDHHQSPSPPVA
ncbi:hypothetical protein FB451DRAFT_1041444 [Mycena latifolia]|nr:hypothetical protein FB451DRAFT_1041444 [Mycena latifolia]